MFGLDERIAALGSGDVFLVLIAIAALLGLRHATDPDHLTAVTTLIAGEGSVGLRQATQLGWAWGGGHALTLVVFGLPIVLFDSHIPASAETLAESAIGVLIVFLSVRLLLRWRRGPRSGSGRDERRARRSPPQAFAIGVLHGIGGSAGVGVFLLAATSDHLTATVALVVFAGCTAISMAVASASCGWVLTRRTVSRGLVPVLGTASLVFGVWYFLGALQVVPYGL